MQQPVAVKKLNPRARLPFYGSPAAAGADLCACLENPVTIGPGETAMIPTGLAMEIPEGYAGLVYARSGLASRRGLAPANKVGVVDADYRGELMVALHNHGGELQTVEDGVMTGDLAPLCDPPAEAVDTDTFMHAIRARLDVLMR